MHALMWKIRSGFGLRFRTFVPIKAALRLEKKRHNAGQTNATLGWKT